MSKPEWGLKRTCQACGTKFYDLQRSPIVCPSCSATFDPEAILKSRRGRTVAPKPAEEAKDSILENEGDDNIELDDADDTLLEDDEDDISVEGVSSSGDEKDDE